MEITIDYEASWRNSFLNGSNAEPLPPNGRNYVASISALKEEGNYIKREITNDTVMGILNRLIGDQRKLYQARAGQYFFKDIEQAITFQDERRETAEVVYLRNMNGSEDQNSYTGMIKSSDPIFTSDYSSELWGVLALDFNSLCQFITRSTKINQSISLDAITVIERLESLNKEKSVLSEGLVGEALTVLRSRFPDAEYVDKKNMIKPIMFYCSSLYLQLERLPYDLDSARTKSGGLSGISKRGFTKKDFMARFTTGGKKQIWGNPYIKKDRVKGLGEVTSMLTKASGQLKITIQVDKQKAAEIKQMIENAGVSAFYLGKKGLAHVSSIRV